MKQIVRIRTRVASVLVPLSFVVLVACGGNEQTATTTQEVDTTVTSDTSLVPTRPPIASATAGQTALVTLSDFSIGMQKTVPPGPTVFTVTNSGAMDHNFVVQRDTVDIARLDTDVRPGENRTVAVELQPGTYRLYCPDDKHVPMETTLTVQK